MAWRDDKESMLQWVAGGLLTVVVSLLCVLYNNLNGATASNGDAIEGLKSRADKAEVRAEMNERLLREVHDDVKWLREHHQ